MIVIVLMFSVAVPPEKPVYVTFDVKVLNDSILKIMNMGGHPLSLPLIVVNVNDREYDGSRVYDRNFNGFWDAGEDLFIDNLDLTDEVMVTVISGGNTLLSMTLSGAGRFGPAIVITPAPPLPYTMLPLPPPPLPPAPCPTPTVLPASYASGLTATYYNNTDWTDPLMSTVVPEIRYANFEASTSTPWLSTDRIGWPVTEIGRSTNFSVAFSGYLLIDTADMYTFYLRSDDCGYMQLDGAYVINNAHVGYDWEKTWTGPLSAGYHPITVLMSQYANKSVIHLQYSSLGLSKRFVTKLYHEV